MVLAGMLFVGAIGVVLLGLLIFAVLWIMDQG